MVSCGGHTNLDYFAMLERPISEAVYHLELFKDVQEIMYPQKTRKGKLAAWGMNEESFEWVADG